MQSSVIPDLPTPTAVVCHDAGAANIIQAWIAARPMHDWRPVMAGPAAKSWFDPHLTIPVFPSLESALDGAAVLLSGTGWSSDVEHRARKLARARGIRNIAVLDHWVNYRERFLRNGEMVLPDEIFVTDEYALLEARLHFPDINVCVHENLYFAAQLSELRQLETNADEVLYLLEPIRADWPKRIAGEFEALEYFLEHWGQLNIPGDASLRLRPHPSDPPGKYSEWLRARSASYPRMVMDDSQNLAKAMARARWVAGCETNAMVVALASGRTVISSLPPWAPPCRLPHKNIIRLSQLDLR